MPNNIYPDYTNTIRDIPYTPALAFVSPVRGQNSTPNTDGGGGGIPQEIVTSDRNVDGGAWDNVYLPSQKVNGGIFS